MLSGINSAPNILQKCYSEYRRVSVCSLLFSGGGDQGMGWWKIFGKDGTDSHNFELLSDIISLSLRRERPWRPQATDHSQLLPADKVLQRCVTTADGYQLPQIACPCSPVPSFHWVAPRESDGWNTTWPDSKNTSKNAKGDFQNCFFLCFFYDQLRCAIVLILQHFPTGRAIPWCYSFGQNL